MGNVYRRSISILLPMCVMNCGIAVASAQRGIEAEEYAVYAAVITNMFVRKDTKLVVINDQTLPMPWTLSERATLTMHSRAPSRG